MHFLFDKKFKIFYSIFLKEKNYEEKIRYLLYFCNRWRKNKYYVKRISFDCDSQEAYDEAYQTYLFAIDDKHVNGTYFDMSRGVEISSEKMKFLTLRSYLRCLRTYAHNIVRK